MSEQEMEETEAPKPKPGAKGLLFGGLSVLILAGVAAGAVYVSPFGEKACGAPTAAGMEGRGLTKG